MNDILNQDIQYLPGVGPKRADLLRKELEINTFGDLLYYFPYRYIDRTQYHQIRNIHPDLPYIQIKGRISHIELAGNAGRRAQAGSGY